MAAKPTSSATITLPKGFKLQSVDEKLTPKSAGRSAQTLLAAAADASPSLGVLSNFNGTFVGNGFNTIWRPANGTHVFENAVPDRQGRNPLKTPAPIPPNEAILELNLTTEELSFTKTLGNVPNRGLAEQADITLSGVSYVQVVRDVTNIDTGKADGTPQDIHFEPGLWMHVPATKTDHASLARMGSIPHGTTINAQCPAPTPSPPGAPPTPPPTADIVADIRPFKTSDLTRTRIGFPAMVASNPNASRLPQNLDNFGTNGAGTITQEILNNPNLVLVSANNVPGKKILSTITFEVSTAPGDQVKSDSDGISNIAFLEGKSVGPPLASAAQNADAAMMTARFWISTVQHEIAVPEIQPGEPPLRITAPAPFPGAAAPVFVVNRPNGTEARKILVNSTQIQYSQMVNLDFATLTWPHASVATLVPAGDIEVLDAAFDQPSS